MADLRGIDNDPGWINRKFRELERMIEGLRSERRAASTSVDTGSFRVTANGEEVFRIGDMEFGDRGLIARRQDGSVAFAVKRLSADTFVGQSVAIYDGSEIQVLSTDAILGGLRAPYFEIPFQPYSATPGTSITCGPYGFERTTTSGTFETVFVYDGKRQNVFLDAKVAARASDATTTGEVRIVDLATGTPLPDFFGGPSWVGTIPASSTSYLVLDPGASQAVTASTGGFGSYMRLGVQARRTAGAGTLTIAVPSALGG